MAKDFEQLKWSDVRRIRSESLVHHILHIVEKHLSAEDNRRNVMRDIAYELDEKFRSEGVEIITDALRSEAGLPPRGDDGWTIDELTVLERRRIELMMGPLPPLFVVPKGEK